MVQMSNEISGKERVLYEKPTKKYKITISQKGSMRFLKYNNTIHSILDEKRRYTNSYHDYFLPIPLLYKNPRILVVGLGGGTIPFRLSKMYGKNATIEVVESEREMIKAALHFLPSRPNFKITVSDGFSYIRRVKGKYDLIILDAFVDDHIPEVFLTEKFISSAKRALADDGILAINYAPGFLYMYVYLHRLGRFFKTSRIRNILFGNYILICSKRFTRKEIKEKILHRMKPDSENAFLIRAFNSL